MLQQDLGVSQLVLFLPSHALCVSAHVCLTGRFDSGASMPLMSLCKPRGACMQDQSMSAMHAQIDLRTNFEWRADGQTATVKAAAVYKSERQPAGKAEVCCTPCISAPTLWTIPHTLSEYVRDLPQMWQVLCRR